MYSEVVLDSERFKQMGLSDFPSTKLSEVLLSGLDKGTKGIFLFKLPGTSLMYDSDEIRGVRSQINNDELMFGDDLIGPRSVIECYRAAGRERKD
jgi:hypothetical protein